MKKMNDRHKAFADEYLKNGFNATQAYMAVYGVKKQRTAEVNGNRLLSNAEVKAYIEEAQAQMSEEAEIDRKYILNEYVELLASCKEEGMDGQGTIKDRTNWAKALSQLTKMLGLDEPERSEITHKGINITINKPKGNDETNKEE